MTYLIGYMVLYFHIDIRSGYFQIRTREGMHKRRLLRPRVGFMSGNIMSFGLFNALKAFIRFMNEVLRPLLAKFIVVYFDDILVY